MTNPLAENVPTAVTPPPWIDALAASAHCLVAVIDPAGRVKSVSSGALETLGVSTTDELAAAIRPVLVDARDRSGTEPTARSGELGPRDIVVLPPGTAIDSDRIVLIGARTACAEADETTIDAAMWRAQTLLARHWVHALRGSLNAASLNLALLRSLAPTDGEASGDARMWDTLKGEIRSLDRALTQYLDRSSVEDSGSSGAADLQSILEIVRAQLEPMARKRQVRLDFEAAREATAAVADASRLHASLLLLGMDAVAQAPPRSTLRVTRGIAPGGRVALETTVVVPGEVAEGEVEPLVPGTSPSWRDAIARAVRAAGGAWSVQGGVARLDFPAR